MVLKGNFGIKGEFVNVMPSFFNVLFKSVKKQGLSLKNCEVKPINITQNKDIFKRFLELSINAIKQKPIKGGQGLTTSLNFPLSALKKEKHKPPMLKTKD